MSDELIKISALQTADVLVGNEYVPIVHGGVTKKALSANIAKSGGVKADIAGDQSVILSLKDQALFHNYRAFLSEGENIFSGRGCGNQTMAPGVGEITSEASFNSGYGVLSLNKLKRGWSNVGNGYQALFELEDGKYNTAGGVHSFGRTVNADRNTGWGHYSGYENIDGYECSYFGASTGRNNVHGIRNTLGGCESGYLGNGGSYNSGWGFGVLRKANSSYNTGGGASSLTELLDGQEDTAYGIESLRNLVSGSRVSAFGGGAGFYNNADGGLFLGYNAGYYETGADKLFIDNRKRANEADARLKALIYGVFDDAVANQRFNINAKTTINSGTTNQNAYIFGDKFGISRTSDGAEVVYFSKNSDLGDGTGTTNIQGYNGIQFRTQGPETVKMTLKENGVLNFLAMPTSSAGLASGDIWSDSGIIKIIA